MVLSHFDIVVVGGGPGGSCVAGLLARRGFSVALIEAKRHPRYAVGESLLPQAWRFLDELGVREAITHEKFVKKKGVTSFWNGELRQFEFSWFGSHGDALIVERDKFDELLSRRASALGATLFEDTTVYAVGASENRRLIHIKGPLGSAEISCSTLVDASGQAGIVANQLGLRKHYSDTNLMFLWAYYDGGKFISPGGSIEERDHGLCSEATSYMCEYAHGWGLYLPLRRTSFVGFALPVRELPKNRRELEKFFDARLSLLPNLDLLLDTAKRIPGSLRWAKDFSYSASVFAGPGMFLVGDAACYSDPIFAHGVQFSLFSAYLAANAITRCAEVPGNAYLTIRHYDNQIRQHHEMSLAMARGVVMSSPGFLHWFSQDELNLLASAAKIAGRWGNFENMARVAKVETFPQTLVIPDLTKNSLL